MNLISRKQAKQQGLVRYFTGEPCPFGHVSERQTGSGICLQCGRDRARSDRVEKKEAISARRRAAYAANPEKFKQAQKAMRASRPERSSMLARARRAADPQKYRDASNAYRAANRDRVLNLQREARTKDPDRFKRYDRAWAAANPDKILAKNAKRRAKEVRAIPPWFGELDALVWSEAADLVQRRRAATGIEWHADHMLPLAGRTVSGLHVASNCQVIPGYLNSRKKNKMALTQPGEWINEL